MNPRTIFRECTTPDEIKRLYRTLVMEWHPDRNPHRIEEATRITQEINAAYHAALKGLHGTEQSGSDGETRTYYYNEARETAAAEHAQETLAQEWADGIEILMIGTWLWITGTQRQDKDTRQQLKDLSYRWHSKRGAWYWKPPGSRASRYAKNKSLSDLALDYGARRYTSGGSRQDAGKEDNPQTLTA